MDTLTPWGFTPRTTEERRIVRRREVRASLEERILQAQLTMNEEITPELERLRYEHEIARRLEARAQEEESRRDWEIQASVLHDLAAEQEAGLEGQRQLIATYEAMIAEIEADLAAEQPDPR